MKINPSYFMTSQEYQALMKKIEEIERKLSSISTRLDSGFKELKKVIITWS